jgi:hypothetical protein
MPESKSLDSETALSARDAAHLRARDRKRSTAMVVDNAGVKRILQARAARRAAAGTASRSGDGPTGGQAQQ